MGIRGDLVLTSLRDRCSFRHAGVPVFVRSLRSHYWGPVVVVSSEGGGVEDVEALWDRGIDVRPDSTVGRPGDQSWRWLAYWTFLRDQPGDRRVAIVDAFDVLVQGDPFVVYDGDTIALGAEGPVYRECEWNTTDMLLVQKACGPNGTCGYADWPIINASLVVGPAGLVCDWCLRVATFLLGVESGGGTDMAVTALLYHRFAVPGVRLVTPAKPFAVTGHWVRAEKVGVPTSWDEGACRMAGPGGVYALFHQWDRTRHAAEVVAKWGDWGRPDYGSRVAATYGVAMAAPPGSEIADATKRSGGMA